MTIRTRFAPSPTGYLHVGGLRTALYAFLLARKHHGALILRIEDTDRTRLVPGAVEALISSLGRTGIVYDEGPFLENGAVVEKGDKGPYIQSERLPIYKKYAEQLIESGHAYFCFCTKERLDEVRNQQQIAKMQPKYDRSCLRLSQEEIDARLAADEPHVVRLQIPEGETAFDDVVRGHISFQNKEIDDQVLLKSDGFPTYHLAVVVDDHLMEVTHIIRGEEWLTSTPKHVILYNMFGWDMPVFAHLPLLLNPDKSKLSKRQGDVAVEDFLDKGYLPEALVNFVALLGFNPKGDQEIYTLEELINSFDLTKVNKAGAVFNLEKLDWMNGQYLNRKSGEEISELVQPFLSETQKTIDRVLLGKVCEVEKERMVRLSDATEFVDGYASVPEYEASLLIWKKADAADSLEQLEHVSAYIQGLEEASFDSVELAETKIKEYIESNNLQNGNVLWPLRVALSGREKSPSPFELLWIFGKEGSEARLAVAIDRLKTLA